MLCRSIYSFRVRTVPFRLSREKHPLLRSRRPLSQHLLAALRTGSRCTSAASSTSPRCRLGILLCVDLLHDLLDLLSLQVCDFVARCHDCDLDVFGAGLHDFEEGFDGKLDGAVAVEAVGVVALEEFADCLGGAADGVCFPVERKWLASFLVGNRRVVLSECNCNCQLTTRCKYR